MSHRSRELLRSSALDLAAAVASAILLAASFAPIGQFYLAWIALIPLFGRLHFIKRARHAAALGYLFGILFFAAGFHWLFNATRPGYFVVCLMLSVYPMLAAIVIHRAKRLGPVPFALSSAAAWTATEYLRGVVLGGFPWLEIGHTQSPFLLICQIADVTGVAGVSAWVVLVNAAITRALLSFLGRQAPAPATPGERSDSNCPRGSSQSAGDYLLTPTLSRDYGCESTGGALRALTIASTITLLLVGYGWLRIRQTQGFSPAEIRIALVQSNFVHARGGAKTVSQQQQVDYLLDRSKSIENADIIAWPETMMPPLNPEARTEPGLGGATFFNRTLDRLATFARDRNASIVTGGYFVGGFQGELGKRKATDIRNSVYHISPLGQLVGRYDKIHLVPFAEWLPFQGSESWAHRALTRFATAAYAGGYHLTPASDYAVFESNGVRVVTPICFEDTVARLTRRFFKPQDGSNRKRADLILNISNDGWFNAFEKSLHGQIAIFRSIENRVPSARVSNTGQSAFVDSSGRITSSLAPFTQDILRGACALDPRLTFYTRFGDIFAWLCITVAAGVSFPYSDALRRPFRFGGEHEAIDLLAPDGTPARSRGDNPSDFEPRRPFLPLPCTG